MTTHVPPYGHHERYSPSNFHHSTLKCTVCALCARSSQIFKICSFDLLR
ncbi:hypothetical protein O6H91_02G036100 [Diphasiastrum complanatum]|uniref:Uncharacterized protein n=1 Tax=Diphasiastrum complanatum TaxID=34168 RepID=A0ACC2EED3_DIPCM|nr:hypothetical protein O6H91_02G036100 [Diphasiastrum complanatum]